MSESEGGSRQHAHTERGAENESIGGDRDPQWCTFLTLQGVLKLCASVCGSGRLARTERETAQAMQAASEAAPSEAEHPDKKNARYKLTYDVIIWHRRVSPRDGAVSYWQQRLG